MVEVITKNQAREYIKEEVERQLNSKYGKLIDIAFKEIQKLKEEIRWQQELEN